MFGVQTFKQMIATKTAAQEAAPEAVQDTQAYIEAGDVVIYRHDIHGLVAASVEYIDVSPYYGEEAKGIQRAYVGGLNRFFFDYVLPEDVKTLIKADGTVYQK